MAPLAIPLLIAGTGLMAAGQIQAGRSEAAMAEYNAKLEERRAKEIAARTTFEQKRQAEEGARVMGTMRARMGKAGVVEAPLLVVAKQASELELENLMIGFEGQVGAERARSQAELDRMRGKIAKKAGYMRAGTTLLKGFGSM